MGHKADISALILMDSAAITAIKDADNLKAVKLAAAYFLVQNM